MRMIIMGGGQTGRNLARTLLSRRYDVNIIEKNRSTCEALANELDVAVFRGDGTDLSVLEAAETQDADCFMAVTGVDPDNLVAAQLAKDHFHAKKVIARVSDPRNLDTFRLLGIPNVVCSADALTKMIEQEADQAHMHLIATLNQGQAGICSITLPADSALNGVSLREFKVPEESLIISVIRDGKLIIPNGSTVLHSGDELVAVAEDRQQKALVRLLSAVENK